MIGVPSPWLAAHICEVRDHAERLRGAQWRRVGNPDVDLLGDRLAGDNCRPLQFVSGHLGSGEPILVNWGLRAEANLHSRGDLEPKNDIVNGVVAVVVKDISME